MHTMEFNWYLQGTSDTEISETDSLLFASGTFGSRIVVDDCNDSTHVKTEAGTDKSSGNTPNNVKYISGTTADWGDSTEDLDQILDGECTIKLEITHTGDFQVSDAKFYAYSSSTSTAPDGLDFYAAESGDASWTQAETHSSALSPADQTGDDTTHTFYISTSVCLTDGGRNEGKMRFEGLIT
jgi:hypothetical protein